MILALKILHISAAAIWLGHKILIPGDVRASIRNHSAVEPFLRRMKRAERLGIGSGLVTLLSGVGLAQLVWGLTEAPWRIYVGLAAALAMFVVGATMARPAWDRIESGLRSADLPVAASGEGKFARALALENMLWLVALGTMVA
jgi:hypothetical protein